MMKSIKNMFWVALFVVQPILFAQNNFTTQSLTWLRFQTEKSLSDKWRLRNEIDSRYFIPSFKHYHTLLRSQARYKFRTDAEVGFGVAYFHNYPNTLEAKSVLVSQEIRPQADLTLKHSLGRVKLSHRYQAEYRIIRDTLAHYKSLIWLRYRAQAQVALTAKMRGLASYEVILSQDKLNSKTAFDQNWLYFAVLHPITKSLEAELGYMHIYQNRPNRTDVFNKHILRISLNHQF